MWAGHGSATKTRMTSLLAYVDDYAACESTHVELCVYTGSVDPELVTSCLGIQPTNWQRAGECPHATDSPRAGRPAKLSAWFLSSRDEVSSRDVRRHIDWILDRLDGKVEALCLLREKGCEMHLSCYWMSACGHGGPTLSPSQMGRLAELGLDLAFDIYGA